MSAESLRAELLKQRYLQPGEKMEDMFRRVASWVAQSEQSEKNRWEPLFFKMMNDLDFLPNSPCLMNAGTAVPQLAACFVYPIEDDLESIFNTLKLAALTHKSGGGTGFSFSRLRPKGTKVGMKGETSGPVSFMEVYNKATDAVRQGGRRRGANMGVLRVDHPDIEEFIDAKIRDGRLSNFNISVALSDTFMDSLFRASDYELEFPAGHGLSEYRKAEEIFGRIVHGAWNNGEPGVIFIDKINKKNPLSSLGKIEATNPCGEQPLLPNEACVLGSVNLSNHIKDGEIDWPHLKDTVKTAVRFLDDSIDVSDFPVKSIHDIVKSNRKIGLGVMGFASMLIKLGIAYSSREALLTARKLMSFVNEQAHAASAELAVEKGEFPNFYRSSCKEKRRNALVTTIAPTGSISIIAGTSSGIEPLYSLVTERCGEDCSYMRILEPMLLEQIEKNGLDKDKVIDAVIAAGGISRLDFVPEKMRNILRCATEIEPRVHVLMQAAFQRFVDNAISKTVNMKEDSSFDTAKEIVKLAYKLGCKGITLYRQGTRKQQVLKIACECED